MGNLTKEQEKNILALQSENATLRNIIDHIPGIVFWMDAEQKYLGCNTTAAKILNFSSTTEIIGKRNEDLFAPELVNQISKTNQEVLDSGKDLYLEENGITPDHQPGVFLGIKAPLYDIKNKPIGIIGMSFDITDRKKMENELKIAKEKAEASDHAKSQFIAVMNHELSTPLAGIIGLINLLKQDELSQDENKKIIKTIENCTHHLMNLVNQVLDFSKLEKGNSSVNNTFTDLSKIINEVYNLLKISAKSRGLELVIKFDKNINEAIYTDTHIVLQILINLVNNAIKFTEKGCITVAVNILARKAHTIKLEISVTDTGCGIPADKLDLIFQPFQQLDDAYIRQSSRSGTGLGLAIVKKLCAQLEIDIDVSSTEGLGSTFSLIGEFKTSDLKPAAHTKVKKPTPQFSPKTSTLMLTAKKLRVLLVEDDPVIQYIHSKMLEKFKCHVDIASNGHDAIKTLNEHDIAFVDISLPDISGFEVIKTIRDQNPKSNIPIIALTVHTGKKEKLACLQAGANKFICKPITQAKLRKILMQYIINKT